MVPFVVYLREEPLIILYFLLASIVAARRFVSSRATFGVLLRIVENPLLNATRRFSQSDGQFSVQAHFIPVDVFNKGLVHRSVSSFSYPGLRPSL